MTTMTTAIDLAPSMRTRGSLLLRLAEMLAAWSERAYERRMLAAFDERAATDLGRERSFQGHGMLDVLRALQSI